MSSDVEKQYEARLKSRLRRGEVCRRAERRLANLRRAIAYPVIVYVVFDPTLGAALVPLAIVLIPLAVVQSRYLRSWRRASRAVAFYRAGIDRLSDNWMGRGDTGVRYLQVAGPSQHLYADDLDIFGHGSIFELLSTARTSLGRDVLADWLRDAAAIDEIRARQVAVEELRDDLDLRESLAVLELDSKNIWPEAVERWPVGEPLFPSTTWRIVGRILALAFGGVAVWTLVTGATSRTPWIALVVAIVAEGLFYFSRRRLATAVAQDVGRAGLTLAALARLSAPLHSRQFQSARLKQLQATLKQARDMAHPRWLRGYGLMFQNPVVHLLAVQVFPALDDWRRSHGGESNLPCSATGEGEALCAIAAYAFEHGDDPFPELVDQGACYEGRGVAHPLLPASTCVRNDVRLDDATRTIIISGSNMSGKSTLLRAVGVNAVLAMVGAPVRARKLRISPVAVCTAMRFRDSLHEGNSYFSATVDRLKRIIDELDGERPILFLFDEMLAGTNSGDRFAGAEAVLRKLLDGAAIGMITTHDLVLTELSERLGPTVVNAHCEHRMVDGKMMFDYRLRPGVVKKSNAVALMRWLGLDI